MIPLSGIWGYIIEIAGTRLKNSSLCCLWASNKSVELKQTP